MLSVSHVSQSAIISGNCSEHSHSRSSSLLTKLRQFVKRTLTDSQLDALALVDGRDAEVDDERT